MIIDAKNKDYTVINDEINKTDKVFIEGCEGQRFIAAGAEGKKITIKNGIPGNALGAYLNGSEIDVYGNAQDAVGDTMNDGCIIIRGSVGDAVGYAMRGGKIFVEKNAGYRAGIHIKEYKDKVPVIVIGGSAGCFLGEYQAGGVIVVLNLYGGEKPFGDFCGTGMHGGKIIVRTDFAPKDLPSQVKCDKIDVRVLPEFKYIKEYCDIFHKDLKTVAESSFYLLTPNSANPYKRLYVID